VLDVLLQMVLCVTQQYVVDVLLRMVLCVMKQYVVDHVMLRLVMHWRWCHSRMYAKSRVMKA
jgi:hypothetical protein